MDMSELTVSACAHCADAYRTDPSRIVVAACLLINPPIASIHAILRSCERSSIPGVRGVQWSGAGEH
jgi:hypothetical protein